MTVSATSPLVSYAGAGSSGPFSIPFKFLVNADIVAVKVAADGTTTTLTGNTITGAGDSAGGSLTTAAAVAVGETLRIYRSTARTQPAQYVANGPFPATTHETALDKLTLIAQEADRDIGRAVLAPLGEAGHSLPTREDLKGKFLGGRSTDGALIPFEGVTGLPATDFMASLLSGAATETDVLKLLGVPVVSVLNFMPAALRAQVLDGTLATDVAAYIEAAFAWLPARGGVLYMPGRYYTTRAPVMNGKRFTILGDGPGASEWAANHAGNLFEATPGDVTYRVTVADIRMRPMLATGPNRSVAKIVWPDVASAGYTNFVSRDVEIVGPGGNSAINAGVFQYGYDLRGAWQYGIINTTYFGNPPTSAAWAGGYAASAFLRLDKCFGGWLNRGCIVLFAGTSVLQVGYSEGLYDDGQHIGCGYAFQTDPACPNGGNGFTGIGFWFNGEYNCAKGVIKQRNAYLCSAGMECDVNRWGDNGADWIGFELEDPLDFRIPAIPFNGAPSAGEVSPGVPFVSVGVRVRVVLGNGADVKVCDAQFSNLTTAVDFGLSTTRCTVTDGTTSTGAFGPNNYVNNGTGNNLAWRSSDGGAYSGVKVLRGSDASIQQTFGQVAGATHYPYTEASVGGGAVYGASGGALTLRTTFGDAVLASTGFTMPVPVVHKAYTVAQLNALMGIPEGALAYASNGRKIGEGVGAGTGVPVYRSTGVWRVNSTDAAVAA